MTTSFTVNQADLAFILKQIKIAEATSIGYTTAPVSILQSIMTAYGATATTAAQLPAGLRTVDGTFNNLLPGRSTTGAADTLFPRLTDPVFRNDTDGDSIDFNGPAPGGTVVQGNYGQPGVVVDADPRVISNLVVDMSVNNPAAIAAYLGNPLSLAQFEADHPGMTPVDPADIATTALLVAWVVAHPGQTPLAITNADLQTMPNQSPDIGLSPGFNSWMTFFGQFFDHGLDLVTKGGNETVYIPLQADDPLIGGADGIINDNPATTVNEAADNLPAHLRFMALTRATPTIVDGVPQHENTTTSWIDQNQTYTSHASHQVFLREYVRVGSTTMATGRLLDGEVAHGSVDHAIGNWGEVKAQALTMLGIVLTDFDVHNVPLLLTDQYGKFIPGANGYAQVATTTGFVEGTAAGLALPANTVRTNHAFLNDIAHHAAPGTWDHDHDPTTAKIAQVADADPGVGDDNDAGTYDDEMLNAHFVTGDGRGNENIALTAVHSIFHSEHNRLVEVNKQTILESNDLAFINEWLAVDVTAVPATPAEIAALVWDGERLFQAARFTTEMQYQHLVFEEFARRIQPMVDPFIFNHSPEIDASITAEFAHTVYRFGHSMLTGTVDRLDNNLDLLNGDVSQKTLLAMFLNPQAYVGSGATLAEINGNIIRGLSLDVGNAIDEFIVTDVRSNLLGLPLDLGALNIARGRDTGIPSLNETRSQLYDATGLADLKPYASWFDFTLNIKNAASVVNFIAAYGTHATITGVATLADKRAAAEAIVFGGVGAPADRLAFLNATGAYAADKGGLNDIDLWIGGLAEKNPEFGGMLGTTFNFVFEAQMEKLQFGDRMYYLTRTQGTNLLNQLEPNTFADLVMRNTSLGDEHSTHISGALFITPDHIIELDRGIAQADYNGADPGKDPEWDGSNPITEAILGPKVVRDYTNSTVVDGHDVGGYLRVQGGEHYVLGGTEGNDTLIGDSGIDVLWGDGGNDYLNGQTESDDVFGGEGDDVIEDPFGDDVLRGNQGNDVITSARGADLMFGDQGNDYIVLGQDAAEAFGGTGDDFILGGAGKDFILGNEGSDWIEGGPGFETIAGENSELFFNSPLIGHDVMFGQGDETDYDAESGDDIMGSGPSVFRYEGMFGFDWAIAKHDLAGVHFDLQIPIFSTIPNDILKDRFDQVEGLSGWVYDDHLDGDDRGHKGGGSSAPDSVPTELFAEHLLTQEGVDRIAGMNQWFGGFDGTDARQTLFGLPSPVPGSAAVSTFRDGNILMGGDGNDFLRGRGGYDIIDGDAWLNVRIKIVHDGVTYSAESLSTDTMAMGPHAGKVYNVYTAADQAADPTHLEGATNFDSVAFGGRSITSLMLDRTLNPGELSIIREIRYDDTNVTGPGSNIDTAIFQGTFAEYEIEGSVDINGDGDFNDAGEYGRVADLNGDGDTTDLGENTIARDVNGDGFVFVKDRDTGAVGAIIDGVRGSSRGLLTDDRDLLKNVEQLQFADRLVTIAGGNSPATGTLTISDPTPYDGKVTPYVGQVLVPTLTDFADADGLTLGPNGLPVGISYEWQTTEFGNNSGWTTIQTSDTYTVRSVDPGHVLRAVAVFKDANGVTERIYSAITDNPTTAFRVLENAPTNTVVGLQIPFSVDYDPESFNGQPPPDVDLGTLHHEIDPNNNAGGRFTVVLNGVDFNGFPRYSLVVANGGPVTLNYEAPVHTPANQSHQFVDNQYQVIVNTYSSPDPATRILVALRQFTVLLDNVTGEIVDVAPTLDLTGVTTSAYRDEFTNPVANGSTGTAAWTTIWTETGDTGVSTGEIQIDAGILGGTNQLRFLAGDGGSIQRVANLAGATSATLSYSFSQTGLDAGETVTVQFAADGVTFTDLQTITVGTAAGTNSIALAGPFTANSTVRFVAAGIDAGEDVRIDNVEIAFTTAGPAGNDYLTTFTEPGGAAAGTPVALAAGPIITNEQPTILSATVLLTNAKAGDVLSIAGALPAGITLLGAPTLVGDDLTMMLVGNAALASYQAAIQAIRFSNTSQNPDTTPRVIEISVHDGVQSSAIATATVNVVSTNDAPVAGADSIYTNFLNGVAFQVPEWALLANDSDAEGGAVNITGVTTNILSSLTAALSSPAAGTNDFVTVTDTGFVQGGNFTYAVSDGVASSTGAVTVTRDTGVIDGNGNSNILIGDGAASAFNGNNGNDIILAGAGNDSIQGGEGGDRIFGQTGSDTITQIAADGGRDIVDGGTDGAGLVDTATDTYQLNSGAADTVRIYTRAAFLTANPTAVLQAGTEIVVTRNGTDDAAVIAELDNIEEIGVNALAVSANDGNGAPNGNATVQVIGDFTATSLNFSTITVDGTAGDDVIDISALTSAHRIVFRGNGGHDTILGTLRPQDVIEMPASISPGGHATHGNDDGTTTVSEDDHSVTYREGDDGPTITHASDADDEEDENESDHGGSGCHHYPRPRPGDGQNGTAGSDPLSGGDGNDVINSGAGRDVVFAGAGDDRVLAGTDADLVYGEAGADRLFGEAGNDLLNGGAGSDFVMGGAGDDLIVGELNDGDDTYFGDEVDGGAGRDTLDLSAIIANLTVDLGNGIGGRGNASSAQSGTDTLWSIENVAAGRGDDRITASDAVNVMEGGAGNDTFRFLSAAGADGDTILDFQPGDKIDLVGIDANVGATGNQAFTLIAGGAFTAAGQLAVIHETRADGDHTLVVGNTDGAPDAEFRIDLKGSHALTSANFAL